MGRPSASKHRHTNPFDNPSQKASTQIKKAPRFKSKKELKLFKAAKLKAESDGSLHLKPISCWLSTIDLAESNYLDDDSTNHNKSTSSNSSSFQECIDMDVATTVLIEEDCNMDLGPNDNKTSKETDEVNWFYKISASSTSSTTIPTSQAIQQEKELKLINLHSILIERKKALWPSATNHADTTNYYYNNLDPNLSNNILIREPITPNEAFALARVITNPFDLLSTKKGVNKTFVNRNALKLCNLDKLLNFTMLKTSRFNNNQYFKFADLCGAPGGFTEYLLYRSLQNKVFASGWGLSLTGVNDEGEGCDWRLDHMMRVGVGHGIWFKECSGADGGGDIYDIRNVEDFVETIAADSVDGENTSTINSCSDDNDDGKQNKTHNTKVHLVVADGGFDIQRDCSNQEVISLHLLAAQANAAIKLLIREGTLILKFFGSCETGSRKVLDLLMKCFERVAVVKPVTSRPASAERYFIGEGFIYFEGEEDDVKVNQFDVIKKKLSKMAENNYDKSVDDEFQDEKEMIDSNAFKSFLIDIDLKMLNLNIKACDAILQVLDRSADGTILVSKGVSGAGNHPIDLKDISGDAIERKALWRGNVDKNEYKGLWRL